MSIQEELKVKDGEIMGVFMESTPLHIDYIYYTVLVIVL